MMLADSLFKLATGGVDSHSTAAVECSNGDVVINDIAAVTLSRSESHNGLLSEGVVTKEDYTSSSSSVVVINHMENNGKLEIAPVDHEKLVQMFATRDKHLVSFTKYHEETIAAAATTTVTTVSSITTTGPTADNIDTESDRAAAVQAVGHHIEVSSRSEDLWLHSAYYMKHGTEPKYTNWTETFYGYEHTVLIIYICIYLLNMGVLNCEFILFPNMYMYMCVCMSYYIAHPIL